MKNHVKQLRKVEPTFSSSEKSFTISFPKKQSVALVFASPHSGSIYPKDFLEASRLDPLTLRQSEDAFVNELFEDVPILGAPLIEANFPRVYVDVNRASNELDPSMFQEKLPVTTNTKSHRVAAGLGTIAKIVSDGQEIYKSSLVFSEVEQRIAEFYVPYHKALRKLIENTLHQFGTCLVIDCHSMPSLPNMPKVNYHGRPIDIVLGDCWGGSCDTAIVELAEQALIDNGFSVQRNVPYAGGYTAKHYGKPSLGIHTLQLEISRGIYMDEASITKLENFNNIRDRLMMVSTILANLGWESIAAE